MNKIFFHIILFLSLFTIQIQSQVTQEWVKIYNTSLAEVGYKIVPDGLENIYITGTSGSSVGRDYCTIKYNTTDVQQWIQRYEASGNGK